MAPNAPNAPESNIATDETSATNKPSPMSIRTRLSFLLNPTQTPRLKAFDDTTMAPNASESNSATDATSDIPEFTLYNRLPTELQFKIWEATLPGPRVVEIKGGEPLSSECKAPSTLYVCRQSRLVASKFYVPSFAFGHQVPRTYFDFNIDTLYLRLHTDLFDGLNSIGIFIDSLWDMNPANGVRQVQTLAISLNSEYSMHSLGDGISDLADVLGWFGNIQHLTIVVGHFDRRPHDKEDILFIEPIDVFKTCHKYETFTKLFNSEDVLEVPLAVDFLNSFFSFMSPTEFERSLERSLERKRQDNREWNREIQEEYEEGSERECDFGDVPTPQVEYKVAVTRGWKSYLDCLREGHRRKIEEENDLALFDGKKIDEAQYVRLGGFSWGR